MIGQTISHYRIVDKLGEGGMGVVYKAEDTALERPVALKFLANHLLNDAEAKERFLREAKAAAALHHPNVCPVYEIAEADGKTFLAMAFLKGETLEERIAKGPLPLKDVLDIGRQVAEGLATAHAEGIVHRDIKPANILISPEGRATIMDFGLARLTEASKLTKADQTVGTAAYMSPEQMQGGEVDHRTDIWALGCVLYEMVAGGRPFPGQYDQALAYEIVHEEAAPLTSVRAGIPMELEFIVCKCMAKDREDRASAAHEVSRELRTLSDKLKSGRSTILRTAQRTGTLPTTMTGAQTLNPTATLPPDAVIVKRNSQRALQVLATVATLLLLALLFLYLTQAPPEAGEQPVRRFSFVPPSGLDTNPMTAGPAISPNGKHIAFTTIEDDSFLWVQDLDRDEPRRLAGTEGALLPFWSPDSDYIAFAVGGGLKKISVNGGASQLLCALPAATFFQGTWSPGGESIVFGSGSSLYEVSSQGGFPEQLAKPDDLASLGTGFVALSRPHFLPQGAGDVLVFTAGNGVASSMFAKNLGSGQTKALGVGDRPVYSVATGLLLYQSDRNAYDIWARPFSPSTLRFTGTAFPVRQNARQPSLSQDGTLLYLDVPSSSGAQTLVWRNREGALLETVGQSQPYMRHPSLSPDGRRVAVSSSESGSQDIWVHDLSRASKTRLTFDTAIERFPVWSPSGEEIAYVTTGDAQYSLRSIAADGTGEPVVLVESERLLSSPNWSRDGRYLLYTERDSRLGADIRYIELGGHGNASDPVSFLATSASEQAPQLSPDGRLVAYSSDESGRYEVYLRPFPEGPGRRQASVSSGRKVRWSRDGAELYYVLDQGSTLMAVSVSASDGITVGQPRRLLETMDLALGSSIVTYDVSADGERFLMVSPVYDDVENAASPKIRIVQNWYEEFRDRK